MLNRNPNKRLGSGENDADEIKKHKFFTIVGINWKDVAAKKVSVPTPDIKKIFAQDIPDDKVYGRGALDPSLKHINKVNEWSYVRKI